MEYIKSDNEYCLWPSNQTGLRFNSLTEAQKRCDDLETCKAFYEYDKEFFLCPPGSVIKRDSRSTFYKRKLPFTFFTNTLLVANSAHEVLRL